MKKIKKFAIVPIVLMLSSCVGEEPNNIAYVTALGIDRKEGEYLFTIQFANPIKISGGASEEGGSGGQIVENIAIESPTLYSAINSANAIVSKNLSLAHTKVFVVSEEIAKNGLNNVNEVIARNNEIRPDIYLSIAQNAGEYLEEVKPAIELNPVRYYQLTYENKNGSAIPKDTASDFYMMCLSGDRDAVLPLAGVARADEENTGTESGNGGEGDETSTKGSENESQKDAELNDRGFESGTRDYFPGQAGVKIKNRSEALGLAIFKGDKYIGKLGSTQAELYNILTGIFKTSNITFYSDKSKNPITIKLEEKNKPKYEVDINRKNVKITINLEGELLSASSDHKENNTITQTDKYVSEMISKSTSEFIYEMYRKMDTDILGIKGKAKKKFLTVKEYNYFREHLNPSEWTFNVKTNFKLKRTGMTYYY